MNFERTPGCRPQKSELDPAYRSSYELKLLQFTLEVEMVKGRGKEKWKEKSWTIFADAETNTVAHKNDVQPV